MARKPGTRKCLTKIDPSGQVDAVDDPLRAGLDDRQPALAPPLVEPEPVGSEERLAPVGADPPADVAGLRPAPVRAARTVAPHGLGPRGSARTTSRSRSAGAVGPRSVVVRSAHECPTLAVLGPARLPGMRVGGIDPTAAESTDLATRDGRPSPSPRDRGDEAAPPRPRPSSSPRPPPAPPRPSAAAGAGSAASVRTASTHSRAVVGQEARSRRARSSPDGRRPGSPPPAGPPPGTGAPSGRTCPGSRGRRGSS